MKTEDLSSSTRPYRNPNTGAAGQGRHRSLLAAEPSLNGELSDAQDGQRKKKAKAPSIILWPPCGHTPVHSWHAVNSCGCQQLCCLACMQVLYFFSQGETGQVHMEQGMPSCIGASLVLPREH